MCGSDDDGWFAVKMRIGDTHCDQAWALLNPCESALDVEDFGLTR